MTLNYRIVSEDEANKTFPKRGQMDLTEYENMIDNVVASESKVAQVPLASLSTRALKRRVGLAAKKLGQSVKWSRYDGGETVVFKVTPIREKVLKENDGRRRKKL